MPPVKPLLKFNSDYALSITGITGPLPDNSLPLDKKTPDGKDVTEHPVGTAFMGLSIKKSDQTVKSSFIEVHERGDRSILKERFARRALFYLFSELQKGDLNFKFAV